MMSIVGEFFDLLFPPRCATCSRIGPKGMCDECLGKVSNIRPPVCSLCGEPENNFFRDGSCEDCARGPRPFDMARSAAVYNGVLKEAIHEFKFNGIKGLSKALGFILADYLNKSAIPVKEIDLIVPVPLSSQHEKTRGYNQSRLLAEEVSRALGIRMDASSLKKVKNVKPQFELKREERLLNVRGAFSASRLPDVTVLLVDDIYTTGATVSEAASSLKSSGAKKVYVLTLARTIEK
jgi:ComF family protein